MDNKVVDKEKYRFTEQGNAELFCSIHRENVRFNYVSKKWMIWNGKMWAEDKTGEVNTLATTSLKSLYGEAEKCADPKQSIELSSWVNKSLNAKGIRGALELAKSHVPFAVESIDKNPDLFNVFNGTVDLETGELLPHRKENLITKISPVTYDADAKCPQWMKFIDRIMAGNKDMITYLQKAIGYTLTGSTAEQCMFILFGGGANGKTTLINMVLHLLGDYGVQTPIETLMVRRSEGVRNDIARLHGKRVVAATEGERNQALAEALVKQLTGGDRIAARYMYQEFFEFTPEFKVFLATNHKPVVRGGDHGIWRRLKPIPFTVRIPEDERDSSLPFKLIAEAPGILRWAVEGCLLWRREGLGSPQVVEEALRAYKSEVDVLTDFLETRCSTSPGARVAKAVFRSEYEEFCKANESAILSPQKLRREMLARRFTEKNASDASYWMNIQISEKHNGENGEGGAISENSAMD